MIFLRNLIVIFSLAVTIYFLKFVLAPELCNKVKRELKSLKLYLFKVDMYAVPADASLNNIRNTPRLHKVVLGRPCGPPPPPPPRLPKLINAAWPGNFKIAYYSITS